MPARARRTPPRRTRVGGGQPAAPGAHRRARPIGFADCQRTGTTRRGVTASPCRFDTRAHQISIDRRHFGKTSCMFARGFSREASGPPSPGEPPASAEDHLAIRKMKALLSKQYRTTRVDPLHSYLATNRILQLIYDITCIYEREGSVRLAARRGTKRSPSAKGSSLFQRLTRLLVGASPPIADTP